VYRSFVVYLNIIERSSQLESTTGEVLADKVVRTKAWQLQDVRLLSWETDLCSCNN